MTDKIMVDPEKKVIAEEASADAIEKTRSMQEAVEASRIAQAELSDAKHLDMMIKALKVVFPESAHTPDDQMRIFLPRVPLICQSILTIGETLTDIKKQMVNKSEFILVRILVFGFVALVLIAFVAILTAKAFPHF